jgi:hypothetical protein
MLGKTYTNKEIFSMMQKTKSLVFKAGAGYTWWILPLIFLSALGERPAKPPSEFIVQGLVIRERLPESKGWNDERAFEIFYRDGDWRIQLSGRGEWQDSIQIFLDGDKTCYISSYNVSLLDERRKRGEEVGSNVATAMIRNDPVPYFPLAEIAGPVWLTFLSAEFFRTQQQGEMTPPVESGIMGFRGDAAEEITKQRFLRGELSTSLEVPLRIDYPFRATTTDPTMGAIYQKIEEDFPGQTNAVFRILATTNVHGMLLPRESLLDVHIPAGAPGATEASRFLFHVKTTNVVLGQVSPSQTKAEMPGLTAVSDFRFVRPNERLFFAYRTEKWLRDSEVKQLPQYQRARASLGLPPSRPMSAIVFAVVVLAVTGWLIFLGSKSKTTTKTP